MAYCFNPYCAHPETPGEGTHCQHCRSALALQDRYYGLRLLGQGGFGRTILGEDRGKPSRPRCVIKVFLPQGQGDLAQAAELFQQEAVRLDELGHHGQIPALLGYATQETAQGRSQCIVQEFVPGRNLGQVVQESGPFSEAEVRSVLLSVLPVLQFVHDHQVIHRDVKPANLIQREDGELVLVDFGAAKYATATALGKTGTVIGSAEYAAPEQVQGQARFASDIYGLGVTCLFLLTGMSPFDLFSTLEDEWVWRDYLPGNSVSEEFGAVLDKMIVRAMRKRYGSVQALLGVLAPQLKPDPVVEVQGVAVKPPNLDMEVALALTEEERLRGCETVVMPLEARFSVKIPAGVQLGQRLRLAGKGKVDPYTGSRGDVFLVIGDRPAPPSPQPNTPRPVAQPAPQRSQQVSQSTPQVNQPVQPRLQIPSLQPFKFTTATVQVSGWLRKKVEIQKTKKQGQSAQPRLQIPSLQPFEFTTATVQVSGWLIKKVEIQKTKKQGQLLRLTLPGGGELELVAVPGGSFMMGAPDSEESSYGSERPQHRVMVPPFLLGRYPVTQAQYQAMMGQNPSRFQGNDRPVERVSWDHAVAFCRKLSQHLQQQGIGLKALLPTEAQWEYACRAGTTTPFAFGSTITTDLVNYDGNHPYGGAPQGVYRKATTPVGGFPANAWGLQDMHGNVWEWCWDEYHESYAGKPEALKQDGSIAWSSNPNVLGDDRSSQNCVLRGGSWNYVARFCRSADRSGRLSDYSDDYGGFRVLLSSRTS